MAGRSEKQHILAALHEARGRELVDELAIRLLVEVEIEAVERLAVFAEASLLDASAEQTILAAQQLVADERRQEIEMRQALGGGALHTDLEDVGHPGYPWSNPPSSLTTDCTYANYFIDSPSGTHCVDGTSGGLTRVGNESPEGDGKWGHADLGGNVWALTLDWFENPYSSPCDDCADLTPASYRVFRGGSFGDPSSVLRASDRVIASPTSRRGPDGMRCARAP
ncbi:MAG TPA: SUMF1/EgtB/PvdO family nonheme iron enzyme [Kofleriaceae bacterium]